MSKLRDWLLAGSVLALGRRRRRLRRPAEERVVEPGSGRGRAELVAVAAFGASSMCAIAFVVVYALDALPAQTQFLGLSLGLCFAFVALALYVVARHVVPDEELEGTYHETSPEEQLELEGLVSESAGVFTRKRLLGLSAAGALGTMLLALVTPALSLGPLLRTSALYRTPWRRGRRLVDEDGRPLRADDVRQDVFYTAFPEGADREILGSALVVVRLPVASLQLPPERSDWAPNGIVAYSKICTHAGCAIALYRTPKFPPTEPKPALVCPCHYSTFDPASGGAVEFGPAGRPLPQLPLVVDDAGFLRAGGNFSGPVGPSWWGVRMGDAQP